MPWGWLTNNYLIFEKALPPQYKVQLDQSPPILTPEINLKILQLNQKFHHKWKKKNSEILKDDIELEWNIVKNKEIELDKVNDYMNHPNKYNEISFEKSKMMEYIKENILGVRKIMSIKINNE